MHQDTSSDKLNEEWNIVKSLQDGCSTERAQYLYAAVLQKSNDLKMVTEAAELLKGTPGTTGLGCYQIELRKKVCENLSNLIGLHELTEE